MKKRILIVSGIVTIVALLVFAAFAVDKRLDETKIGKIVQSKVIKDGEKHKRLLQDRKLRRSILEESVQAVVEKKKSKISAAAAPVKIIFDDDFETDQGWQATASYGFQFAPGGGRLDEDHSDWELVTDNFNSPTTSWHESGVTLLQTDMLLSPVIHLPTEVTIGGTTSELRGANLKMAIDWDVADPNNDQFRIYAGRTESLWTFGTSDPGNGSSSWVLEVPTSGPYGEFLRQFLTTPEMAITGPTTLSFLYKSISDPRFDFNKVDISADNFKSFTTVFSHTGAVGTGGVKSWTAVTVDIPSEFEGSTIRIRFSHNGDFIFVEPGNILALDDISVDDTSGNLFFDDGGDTATGMMASGFVPGNQLIIFSGDANPTPNWVEVDLGTFGVDLLDGTDGELAPGDDIQIGFVFLTVNGVAPGRGLYIDDVVVEAIGRFANDLEVSSVECPFPVKVGEPITFTLNVANNGLNPITSFNWTGNIFDAEGNPAANVVGVFSGNIESDSSASVQSPTTWTPMEAGIFTIEATANFSGDEDASNNTTSLLSDDDPNFRGGGFYSAFFVCEENVVFTAQLNDAEPRPDIAALEDLGFRVRSNSDPGVATWQTTDNALIPFVNTGAVFSGAYIQFDFFGRPQDEELLIPNLDFSNVTSDVKLHFKALGAQGLPFAYSRFSVGVSLDGGHSWFDVFEQRGGTDPQTGTDYGGFDFKIDDMNPADIDITHHVAGRSWVWLRFRYEGLFDGDWVIWKVAISGKGLLPAELLSVTDIPNDNGKQVRLTWSASANDGHIEGVPITEYGVWRQVAGSAGSKTIGDDVVRVENRRAMIANIRDLKPGTRFFDAQTQQQWDFVGAVLAHSDPEYNFVAPTLEDELETCFMISAHTANPLVFANSNVACGTSTDDLPPGVPSNFAASEIKGEGVSAVELTWDANEDEDFRFYTMYKNGAQVLQTIDLSYVDTDVNIGDEPTYGLTATDFATNESEAAQVTLMVTSVDDKPTNATPTEFALRQNYPNPFNPQTTIEYQLPENTHVTIAIYDMRGRKVRTLISSDMKAGYHKVIWNARDEAGSSVSSGVYFYKIKTNEFLATYKMILLK